MTRRKIVDVNPIPKTKSEPESPLKKETKQDQPKQKQQPPQKKRKYFDQFQGQQLVVQLKSGNLVEGIIESEISGFITIADAIITSKKYKVEVDWIRIERVNIAHFHPEPKKLTPIADIEKEESVNETIPDWQDKEAYREYTLNLIVELKESGKTLKEIAQALEQSGVKTRSGKNSWHVATISAILKNQQ